MTTKAEYAALIAQKVGKIHVSGMEKPRVAGYPTSWTPEDNVWYNYTGIMWFPRSCFYRVAGYDITIKLNVNNPPRPEDITFEYYGMSKDEISVNAVSDSLLALATQKPKIPMGLVMAITVLSVVASVGYMVLKK